MKILWITNIVFPEAMRLLTGEADIKGSGGWMLASANSLSGNDEIQLVVASVSNRIKQLTRLEGTRIIYYLLPLGKGGRKYNKEYEFFWKEIKRKEVPDIVHIHGTEFSYGLSYIKACGDQNVVVSIQGLTSVIARYYTAGLTNRDILRNITIRDLFGRSIWHEKKKFEQQGKNEIETLRQCKHIIGRTSFDKAYSEIINPEAKYYKCNETLREEFYSGQWDYYRCKRHTIFLSQCWYPLKGAHQVFKAMPFILKEYPDACIRIAGTDITKADTIIQRLRRSGYARYLRNLIHKLHIENYITFTGPLNAKGIKEELLSCNVFVCPSSIENSSNSLAEAQILGVPCVASYAGGLPTMMEGDEKHLYRFEEYEMMAHLIMDVFADSNSGIDMRMLAHIRHDPENNLENLMEIYKRIINE